MIEFDIKTLEPRPWLMEPMLLRGHVSAIVAPPGVGKSTLTLQIALTLCAGAPWAGWEPRKRLNAWIINLEDDEKEMRRKTYAAE